MQNSPFACTQAKKHINGDQISDFCVSGGPPSSQIKTEYSIKLKLCMAMSSGGRQSGNTGSFSRVGGGGL